jgi:hypothetical protein
MKKMKYVSYTLFISIMLLIGCNNSEKRKALTMPYVERRVSFIVLKADCFANYDTSFFANKKNSLPFLTRLKGELYNIPAPVNTDFYKREQRYDTTFDYVAYAEASLKGLRKRIDSLQMKETLNEDDAMLLATMYLYFNCAAYFRDSWYILPEIKFSEDFYQHFFRSKEKKFFEHYLYDSDHTNEFALPKADKYPGRYDYIPHPHIIDKKFAAELYNLLKINADTDAFVKEESNYFKEILEGVLSDKYVLIIKTYM